MMHHSSTISVTLSADLLDHLRRRARVEQVPLSWLVVGLACDTIVAWDEQRSRTKGGCQFQDTEGSGSPPSWN
jgi:hypothetical protein